MRRRWTTLWVLVAWISVNAFVALLGGIASNPSHPLLLTDAYDAGVEKLTRQHLTAGPVIELLILCSLLASLRWIVLEFRVYYSRTPVEVAAIDNAEIYSEDARGLDLAFRDYLTAPRIYQVSEVPEDPEPSYMIEILKAPTYSGWRGTLAAALAYTFPRSAFTVSASLRSREGAQGCGVSTQVRRKSGGVVELETQWSSTFDRALQRAAYAVAAHILPQTRQCRRLPWSGWRGRPIPVSLLRDYQRAKHMVAERRFDYALYLYHSALLQDANNAAIQYDIGQLYERLGLYPDALATLARSSRVAFRLGTGHKR